MLADLVLCAVSYDNHVITCPKDKRSGLNDPGQRDPKLRKCRRSVRSL